MSIEIITETLIQKAISDINTLQKIALAASSKGDLAACKDALEKQEQEISTLKRLLGLTA